MSAFRAVRIGNFGRAYLYQAAGHVRPEELADVDVGIFVRVDVSRAAGNVTERRSVKFSYHAVDQILPIAFEHFAGFDLVVIFGGYLLFDTRPQQSGCRFDILCGYGCVRAVVRRSVFVDRPNIGGYRDTRFRDHVGYLACVTEIRFQLCGI